MLYDANGHIRPYPKTAAQIAGEQKRGSQHA